MNDVTVNENRNPRNKSYLWVLCLPLFCFLLLGWGCVSTVIQTPVVTTTNGVSVTNMTTTVTKTLNTQQVIEGINLVVPFSVRMVTQKDTNTVAYFQQVAVILSVVADNGVYDMQMITNSLNSISIKELRTPDALLAEKAILMLYQDFANQVVSSKLDQTVWLKPVLVALSNAIKAGL